jgi:excisionase family DNA binding protein
VNGPTNIAPGVAIEPGMRHLSPAAVARLLGVRHSKVFSWIRSGELRAANLATVPGSTPRYRISPAALSAFLSAREVVPAPPRAPRRARRTDEVIEFF